MDEDHNMVCGIDKLAELLAERGIEFCVGDRTSLVFMDGVGNLHECWMAGVDENRVNALIVVTPEQLLSVPDLNSIIAENARLRELVLCLLTCASDSDDACDKCPVNGGSGIWDFADFCDSLLDRVRELRIEVEDDRR